MATLALLLTTSVVTCSFAASDEITVAGVVFQDDQFMNMLTKGYQDAARDLGVKCLTDNTNGDQAREVELINTYLSQGVKGIAIAPLSQNASIAQLRAADAQGMKVAITNMALTDADFIVGGYTSDDYKNCQLVGEIAGKAIKERYGDQKVKLALIQFMGLIPEISQNRVNGYLDAIKAAGVDFEIVADQDGWLQDTALAVADAIITANPDLDVIVTINDGGTIGSTMAVINAGKADRIMVFGHDGSDQISSLILDENSPLYAAIAQDPYGQGYNAMTTLVKAIRGGDISDSKGRCQFLDGIVMSKSDIEGVNKWRADQGF